MARASGEQTAWMSGEDTPTAKANALRHGTVEHVPTAAKTAVAKSRTPRTSEVDTSMAEANASRGGMTRRSDLAAGTPKRWAAAAAQRTWLT